MGAVKNTRVAFILISIITIILLAGSVFLQRIVFKAAESSSSVYLSPNTFIVKPNGQIKLDIVSDFSIPAYVAAAQFVIEYDKERLLYQAIQPTSGFTTRKISISNGKVSWLVTPDNRQVSEQAKTATIGQLQFMAKSAGSTFVTLNPRETIISAIDPQGDTALYNAVRSVQNTIGEITDLASESSVGNQTPPGSNSTPSGSIFSTQRVIHSEVVPLADQTLMMIGLRYTGNIAVDFGQNENLGSTITTTISDNAHLLTLNELLPATKYYYQLKILSPANEPLIVWPIRTFSTVVKSTGAVSGEKSQVIAQQPITNKQTKIFLIARDNSGNVVDTTAQFRITEGEATLAGIPESNPPQTTLIGLTNTKQQVTVEAFINSQVVGATSVVVDPALTLESAPGLTDRYSLSLSQSAQLTLIALLAVLLLLGFALARLLKLP